MNTLNMHLMAMVIDAQRGIAPRPAVKGSRREHRPNANSAIERQIDEIQNTFTQSWEW